MPYFAVSQERKSDDLTKKHWSRTGNCSGAKILPLLATQPYPIRHMSEDNGRHPVPCQSNRGAELPLYIITKKRFIMNPLNIGSYVAHAR